MGKSRQKPMQQLLKEYVTRSPRSNRIRFMAENLSRTHTVFFDTSAVIEYSFTFSEFRRKRKPLDVSRKDIAEILHRSELIQVFLEYGCPASPIVTREFKPLRTELHALRKRMIRAVRREPIYRNGATKTMRAERYDDFMGTNRCFLDAYDLLKSSEYRSSDSERHQCLHTLVNASVGDEKIFVDPWLDTDCDGTNDMLLYTDAISASILDKKPVALLTGDTDFIRLHQRFCNYVKVCSPNHKIPDALVQNPVEVFVYRQQCKHPDVVNSKQLIQS